MIGIQGSGKSTQCAELSALLKIPHISSGDLLRELADSGTEQGKEMSAALSRGEMSGDALIEDLMRERLSKPDAEKGFILDGYPRTAAQAASLNQVTTPFGLDAVLELTADRPTVTSRLVDRKRSDDTKSAIERRLELFAANHGEVIEALEKSGTHPRSIDASRPQDEVLSAILDAIGVPSRGDLRSAV